MTLQEEAPHIKAKLFLGYTYFVFDPRNGNSIVVVVTLDVRGASLVNDESGIYRCGAQSTLSWLISNSNVNMRSNTNKNTNTNTGTDESDIHRRGAQSTPVIDFKLTNVNMRSWSKQIQVIPKRNTNMNWKLMNKWYNKYNPSIAPTSLYLYNSPKF